MRKKNKVLLSAVPIAACVAALGVGAPAAHAATSGTTYQAKLAAIPLNTPAGAASGTVTVTLDGNQATITEHVNGLADKLPTDKKTLTALGIPVAFAGAPFPHVQHIHGPDAALGAGGGGCPTAAADSNHDGLITTGEAGDNYGPILTTLSTAPGGTGDEKSPDATNVKIAPGGGSFTYNRTITLSSASVAAITSGKAAIVVHGLNPANAPKASLTVPNTVGLTLPGASKPVAAIATSPALCGVLQASQMSTTPVGGVQTGGGSTSGVQDMGLIYGAGALVLGAGAVFETRRRYAKQH